MNVDLNFNKVLGYLVTINKLEFTRNELYSLGEKTKVDKTLNYLLLRRSITAYSWEDYAIIDLPSIKAHFLPTQAEVLALYTKRYLSLAVAPKLINVLAIGNDESAQFKETTLRFHEPSSWNTISGRAFIDCSLPLSKLIYSTMCNGSNGEAYSRLQFKHFANVKECNISFEHLIDLGVVTPLGLGIYVLSSQLNVINWYSVVRALNKFTDIRFIPTGRFASITVGLATASGDTIFSMRSNSKRSFKLLSHPVTITKVKNSEIDNLNYVTMLALECWKYHNHNYTEHELLTVKSAIPAKDKRFLIQDISKLSSIERKHIEDLIA